MPEPVGKVAADLDGHAAEDERPKYEPEREVEPGERGGHHLRESEQERSAESEQPDLVPAPERAERGDDLAALGMGLPHDQMQGPGADVPAVEDHEYGQQDAE